MIGFHKELTRVEFFNTEGKGDLRDFSVDDLRTDQNVGMGILEHVDSILNSAKSRSKMIGTEFKKLLRETKDKSDQLDKDKLAEDEKQK